MQHFNFSVFSTKKENPASAINKKNYKYPSKNKRDHSRKHYHLEIPGYEDYFKKPVIIENPFKKPVTYDKYKCEQCGKRLNTKNYLTNHMISDHKQPGEVFKCDACDFTISRRTGLKIQTSNKLDVMEHLDGNKSISDEGYAESFCQRVTWGLGIKTRRGPVDNRPLTD